GIAAADRCLDAMMEMIVQHLGLDLRQRGADRLELGEHIDAVALFLDHAGDAAHLTLDPAEPIGQRRLVVAFHAALNNTHLGYMSTYLPRVSRIQPRNSR